MKYTTRIKPISYVKSNAAEIIRELAERRELPGHHPERRSQGGHAGRRHLR